MLTASGAIVITLAGPPVAKGRPRFTRKGIAFTPAKTRSFENLLRFEASQIMQGKTPLESALTLTLEAFLPIPSSWSKKQQLRALGGLVHPTKRPDCDNLLKTIDSLNGIVWRDDKQIIHASVTKAYSDRPRIVLTVREV